MGKIARLVIVIAIGISLLFGTLGCSEEITEPPASVTPPKAVETPESVTTLEPETAAASSLSYVIVDTDQNKCYDNSQEIACPHILVNHFMARMPSTKASSLLIRITVMVPLPILIPG